MSSQEDDSEVLVTPPMLENQYSCVCVCVWGGVGGECECDSVSVERYYMRN